MTHPLELILTDLKPIMGNLKFLIIKFNKFEVKLRIITHPLELILTYFETHQRQYKMPHNKI